MSAATMLRKHKGCCYRLKWRSLHSTRAARGYVQFDSQSRSAAAPLTVARGGSARWPPAPPNAPHSAACAQTSLYKQTVTNLGGCFLSCHNNRIFPIEQRSTCDLSFHYHTRPPLNKSAVYQTSKAASQAPGIGSGRSHSGSRRPSGPVEVAALRKHFSRCASERRRRAAPPRRRPARLAGLCASKSAALGYEKRGRRNWMAAHWARLPAPEYPCGAVRGALTPSQLRAGGAAALRAGAASAEPPQPHPSRMPGARRTQPPRRDCASAAGGA